MMKEVSEIEVKKEESDVLDNHLTSHEEPYLSQSKMI